MTDVSDLSVCMVFACLGHLEYLPSDHISMDYGGNKYNVLWDIFCGIVLHLSDEAFNMFTYLPPLMAAFSLLFSISSR